MKSWKRKVLLTIALGSFFIIAPTLVFYAIGYRYDFENKAFRKIGMIIIESEPKDADIFINNKYKSKTPFRIKNLLPNEYDIKVNKENFNSWEKTLSVESKKVTWASNIKLFYENPKISTISEIQFEDFNISPNFKTVITFSKQADNQGLYLIDLETKEAKNILDINKQNLVLDIENSKNINFSDFKWSPDNKKLIVTENKKESQNFIVLDSQEINNSFSLNSFYDLNAKKAEWKNENEIYLLDESKNLHQVSLSSQLQPSTVLKDIIDFDYDQDEGLLYLREDETNIKLLGDNNDLQDPIMNLAKGEKYKIESGNKNNVAILSLDKKKLYLIDKETKKPLVIGENIDNFKWSPEKNKLAYFNNNEIWFYVPKKEEDNDLNKLAYKYNEPNLLTRYSTIIDNVTWYPDEEYLTILLNNSIKIIELDGRDKRNCYELKEDLKIKNKAIEFDKKGEKIYYIDNNKNNNLLEAIITEN